MNSVEENEEGWISVTDVSKRMRASKETARRVCRDAGVVDRVGSHGKVWLEAEGAEAVIAAYNRVALARQILRRQAFGEIVLDDDDLLTSGDVGLLLGVTANTISNKVRDREIDFVRTAGGHARIRYAAVRAHLEEK